MFVLRI